jgi:hypothetical protein
VPQPSNIDIKLEGLGFRDIDEHILKRLLSIFEEEVLPMARDKFRRLANANQGLCWFKLSLLVLIAPAVVSVSSSHDVHNSPPQHAAHSNQLIGHTGSTATLTHGEPKLCRQSSDYFADFPDFELSSEKDAELLALLDGDHDDHEPKKPTAELTASGRPSPTCHLAVTNSNVPLTKDGVHDTSCGDVAKVSAEVSALPATPDSDFVLPRFVNEMIAKNIAPSIARLKIVHCLQEQPGYKREDWERVLEQCGFYAYDKLALLQIMNSFMDDDDGPVFPDQGH